MISMHPAHSFFHSKRPCAPFCKNIFGFRRSWKKLKRCLQNPKTLKILIVFSLVIFTINILYIQILNERRIKANEVTSQIASVLGTRLTAVRLLPDKNTTRVQPNFDCDDFFSIILIKSTPDKYWKRQILRNTWFKLASQTREKVKTFFFVNVPSGKDITMNLKLESDNFNDIIIEDLDEHHYLQTLKFLRMLKWFNSSSSCLNARYLIKTDDDSFLHIPNILNHIETVPNAWVNYIGGELHLSDSVNSNPDSKWFAPSEWWSGSVYPPYVTGPLVVITSEAVPTLLSASVTVPLHNLEDVFISGMVGFDKLSIVPNHMPRIDFNSPQWMVRLKMALSTRDLAKTNLAFHCAENVEFIEELYKQAVS